MSLEQSAEIDLNSAIEQIKNMMGSSEGQAKLNNIIGAFTGMDDRKAEPQTPPSISDDAAQLEMMAKLGKVMSKLKAAPGREEELLKAIRPYLGEARQAKTDSAVRMMGMFKAFSAMRESGMDTFF